MGFPPLKNTTEPPEMQYCFSSFFNNRRIRRRQFLRFRKKKLLTIQPEADIMNKLNIR